MIIIDCWCSFLRKSSNSLNDLMGNTISWEMATFACFSSCCFAAFGRLPAFLPEEKPCEQRIVFRNHPWHAVTDRLQSFAHWILCALAHSSISFRSASSHQDVKTGNWPYGHVWYCIIYDWWMLCIHMSSRQNPSRVSSRYCDGYRFLGGPLPLREYTKVASSHFDRDSCVSIKLQ